MSAAPGLGSANLRLKEPGDAADLAANDITVELAPQPQDAPDIDEKGNILRITHGDGSVSVSLDGRPLGNVNPDNDKPKEWFDNLVDSIDEGELRALTEDLLLGIEEDLLSRKDWIEDRATGMRLLGLKIEVPGTQGTTDGAPIDGMSKVRHPLLLEAVLRFQANARSELLPTDGPVKIRNDDGTGGAAIDKMANALEMDLNHYLTTIATEYYPDTDRMLFMIGFGGSGFKKVYRCPLRNRPVSEAVDADDLIVNQSATDLANAQRVTHRTMLRPSTVKRLQILGVYRDIDLGDPVTPQPDALKLVEQEQQGLTDDRMRRPENREREVYEVCCELNIKGFEHKFKGKETGLQIPYVVTIDKSSRKALAVVRNYEKDDLLATAKKRFVKFPFVPGIGFYDIGLLHILGNTTNAATAGWREMLDNGMFANFPGFLISKSGTRQNTSVFRVPPGGGAQVDTQGMPIGQSVMALPYESQHMAPLGALIDNMVETGRRIGGTAEVQVGEGRADVPVGTVMAMIDQAIKVMNAVHKRMCTAQAEELELIRQLFKENPESFYSRKCKSKTAWNAATLIAALQNCALVPQADPNTSSSGQRLMKVMALKQLQQASQNLYDPIKVDTAALAAIGWPNPDEFFVPPAARAQPPPQLVQAQTEMANETKKADAAVAESQARTTEAKAKATEAGAKVVGAGHFAPKTEAPKGATGLAPQDDNTPDYMTAQAKLMDAHTGASEVGLKAREVAVRERTAETEAQNRDLDREAQEREAAIQLAGDVIRAPTTEGGGQVATAGAGKRARRIIKDVDKGLPN